MKLKYTVIIVLFILIALIISHLMLPIDIELRRMARFSLIPIVGMQLLYYLLGALLGIEHLIDQFKKSGRFKFNLERFLIVGIPAFVLSIEYLELYYVRTGLYYTPTYMIFLRMVFGYYLITSMYKDKSRP